jgi:Spy/CpxP family protein refolding chaperone
MAKKNDNPPVKDADKLLKNLNLIATQMEELVNLSRSQLEKIEELFEQQEATGARITALVKKTTRKIRKK